MRKDPGFVIGWVALGQSLNMSESVLHLWMGITHLMREKGRMGAVFAWGLVELHLGGPPSSSSLCVTRVEKQIEDPDSGQWHINCRGERGGETHIYHVCQHKRQTNVLGFLSGGSLHKFPTHLSSMLLQRASGKCQSAKKAWAVIPGVGRKLLLGSLVPTRASWMQISYHGDEGVHGSGDFQSRAEVGRSAVPRKKYPTDRWLQNPGVQLAVFFKWAKVVRPHTNAELLSLFHISSSLLLNTFVILNSNSSLS